MSNQITSQMTNSVGPCDQSKDFQFYSKSDKKSTKDLKHRGDII